jgi:hypothetical protein
LTRELKKNSFRAGIDMLDFRFLSDEAQFQSIGRLYPIIEGDFLGPLTLINFTGGNIASGTQVSTTTTAKNHPGVVVSKCHATNANSGFYNLTAGTISLTGNEVFREIFKHELNLNTVSYLGLMNNVSIAPDYAVIFTLLGGVISGKIYAGGVLLATTTTSSYQLSEGSWYRAELSINSTRDIVVYKLYDEQGKLLWADVIYYSLVPLESILFGVGSMSYVTTSPGAVNLISIDYIGFFYTKPLAR